MNLIMKKRSNCRKVFSFVNTHDLYVFHSLILCVTSWSLGEMFDFDFAGFDGGLAGFLACADPVARTPIGDTRNNNIELTLIGISNINCSIL